MTCSRRQNDFPHRRTKNKTKKEKKAVGQAGQVCPVKPRCFSAFAFYGSLFFFFLLCGTKPSATQRPRMMAVSASSFRVTVEVMPEHELLVCFHFPSSQTMLLNRFSAFDSLSFFFPTFIPIFLPFPLS